MTVKYTDLENVNHGQTIEHTPHSRYVVAKYYNKWYLCTIDNGRVTTMIPIRYCPYCGQKLDAVKNYNKQNTESVIVSSVII